MSDCRGSGRIVGRSISDQPSPCPYMLYGDHCVNDRDSRPQGVYVGAQTLTRGRHGALMFYPCTHMRWVPRFAS